MEWTAIATFVAAGAAVGLGLVTLFLVLAARDEIKIERQRIDEATKPRVFPAPTGNWGNDNVYVPEFGGPHWRNVLPVTNGGPGVALNVKAQLRRTPESC